MKKVLLLTDSRGVHRPVGTSHPMYAERLAKTPGIKLISYRCPFKWTTTLDLLQIYYRHKAENFDHVILHAGIVDHSPRNLASMLGDLVDPENFTPADEAEELIKSRDFSKKKIVNRKRALLEEAFGKKDVDAHFRKPFDQMYEGQKTINLYSLEMLKESLIPRLNEIKNLTFISSNTFSRGWNGDYPRARPENIFMIEDYSRALCEGLSRVINLHQWTDADVRRFTCDNLHLAKEGSDWIYSRILEDMGLAKRDYFANRRSVLPPRDQTPWPLERVADRDSIKSIRMTQQKPLQQAELVSLRKRHGIPAGAPLATLVIGFRLGDEEDNSRLVNMRHLVQHLQKTYPDAFDILLVEQDKKQKFEHEEAFSKCRYAFLYNPNAYNRGWLYNVAAKHYSTAAVLGFLDTDVIPGANFLTTTLQCVKDFDAISPNRNLFYATAEQTDEFRRTGRYSHFPVTAENIKNPTTLAGGMMVVNREAFLSIGGFEQYVGYGCEDRALDVTMFALLPLDRIRMDSEAYFHQYHPVVESERAYFRDIYNHMAEHYGCEYTPGLAVTDYIHKNCRHSPVTKIAELRDIRKSHIGDPELYRNNGNITVNGLPGRLNTGFTLIRVEGRKPVFPPDFDGVKPYNDSEELTGRFANSWAPAASPAIAVDDTRQLQFFYNRFKGKRCFIIGNGPSLNQIDLSLLKNEYTFAVNSIYYKTRETGFTPTFFVVEDSSVIKENLEEIVNYKAPFKFFPSIYQSLHPKVAGTYFFPLNRGFYDKFSPNYAIPRFSTDVSKVAYCGQSVTYINLQLAYYMGFTEVYLIGMDFSYFIPASHARNGDVLTSDTDDPNHFHKDYFGKGKTWKDPKLDRVLMNYQMAKLVYECGGRKIYNATKGGMLEAFERVDYDGLFGGFDKRLKGDPLDLARPDESWSKLKSASSAAPAAAVNAPAKKAPPPVEAHPPASNLTDSFSTTPTAQMLLINTCSELLTNPKIALKRLTPGSSLRRLIDETLSSLPKDDKLRLHYEQTEAFVSSKHAP